MKPLAIVLLIASVLPAQDRYFASGQHRGLWVWLYDQSGDRSVLNDSHADIDITISDDRSSIQIHEASYTVTSLESIMFNRLPIDLHAEFRVKDITLPLNQVEGGINYHVPLEVFPDVKIYGSYAGQDFDILLEDVDLETEGIEFANFIFGVRYRDAVEFKGGTGLRLTGDFGFGESTLAMYGRPWHQDVERVPTPEERESLLPGDADMDGEVTFADFLTLSDRYGRRGTWGHGDFTGDFEVDFSDFLVLSNNYSQTTAAAVPEPASVILAAISLVVLFSLRSKR